MTEILDVRGREILDSRGNPTVEVELVTASGFMGRAAVPSGASTGQNEAVELRDGDESRYLGKGVAGAVENVNDELAEVVLGMDVTDGRALDMAMILADGTENKERLGANAILGVSIAAAKAAAEATGLPLFRYLGGPGAYMLPVPCANILNGGAHAANNVDFQEFMVVPVGFESFKEALRCVAEVYQGLKRLLSEKKLGGGIGDEGGFAPDLDDNREALALMAEAVERSGYSLDEQVAFALDPAASEFHEAGTYKLSGEGETGGEGAARRRRPVRDQPEDSHSGHRRGCRQLHPHQGKPDRDARGDVRDDGSGTQVRVYDHGQSSERGDGGRNDLGPFGGGERRTDKDRGAGPRGARREVQSAPAHRGGFGKRRVLPGARSFQSP